MSQPLRRAALALAWAAACAGLAPASEPVVRGEEGARLDAYLRRLADYDFSGVVLVARGGRPVLEAGYGLADREAKRPFSPDTVVSLGSITKQFTAAAVLKLEAQGKLAVGDPVTKFFKGVPADKAGITLHHLLTHSAGLESDFGEGDFEPVSREEIIRRALASKLRSRPGERYHYSNAGYSLLAAVVELVSGQGYETYLRDNLFKPAGMTRTGYRLPGWRPEELAQGYRRGRRTGTIVERPWAADGPYWNLRGNGGIHTTAGDMLKWHLALEGDAVLPKEARAKMFTPHVREGDMPTHYGYGWVVGKTPRGTRLIEHNGGDGTFSADCKRYTDDGVFVFATSNNSDTPAWAVTPGVEALLFGGDCPTPPAVAEVDPSDLKKCAGVYRLPSGGKLTAEIRQGRLVLGGEGQDALSLLTAGKPGADEGLAAASARTAAIFEANARGDYGPLQKALGDGAPPEGVAANQKRLRAELEGKHGAYRGFEVLGSVRAGRLTDTYVRLQFADDSVLLRYVWEGGRLVVLGPAPAPAGARTFRPLSATEFAAFDFVRGRTTRVRFRLGSGGAVAGLAVGDATAERAGG
jgi:CubicO group peptidase (beta-lactamase class C family)